MDEAAAAAAAVEEVEAAAVVAAAATDGTAKVVAEAAAAKVIDGTAARAVRACVEINQCVGYLSHFSAMTLPCWLRRAVGNRHRHAIEQASHRRRERAVKF